jgi:hypothetical protein
LNHSQAWSGCQSSAASNYLEFGETLSMNVVGNRFLQSAITILATCTMFALAGCSPSLPKGAVGNAGNYNYSPSVIETGDVRQFWWCSQGTNPNDSSQDTDAIFYESVNQKTLAKVGPVLVLAETPGAWDSAYTCNPKVIEGVFTNPLGDGQTYTYAMYYVATATIIGINNSIGVAFSNDGMTWKKYPQPVIPSTSVAGYGVGQPSLYNADHKSAIVMFYEDTNQGEHHVEASSIDGIHFTVQGTLTTNGLDPDDPLGSWGDVSYDSVKGEWYALFCRPARDPSTTGNVIEHGQYGVELYKIPKDSVLTGTSPWQQLVIKDTNATGYESNFIAGFVHDSYGNINVAAYPEIDFYTSTSYPAPSWDATPADAGNSARADSWILLPMSWNPGTDFSLPLTQYYNGTQHEVTSGWVSPGGGFLDQQVLGHIYANPLHGATVPLYGCKGGQTDYFVSLDSACEGQRILGKDGYMFASPTAGSNLVPIYRCTTGQNLFVSTSPSCEGQTMDELLGYIAP